MTEELLITVCIGVLCLTIGAILGLRQGWKDAKQVYGKDNPYVTDVD